MSNDMQAVRQKLARAALAAAAAEREAVQARAVERENEARGNDLYTAEATAERVLGDYATGAVWELKEDPAYPGERVAEATIDGLRFRVDRLHGSGLNTILYLLRQCPAFTVEDVGHDSERATVAGLADLGRALSGDQNTEWWCATCGIREYEKNENRRPSIVIAPPPTVEERLVGVLRELVDGIVSERLDIPDRV